MIDFINEYTRWLRAIGMQANKSRNFIQALQLLLSAVDQLQTTVSVEKEDRKHLWAANKEESRWNLSEWQ